MGEYIERGEHDEFVKRMEDEHIRLNKRLIKVEDEVGQITKLTLSVEKLAIGVGNMVEEQKKQGERLEKLEDVPADNWRTLKVGFLSAIAGAAGTGLISLLIK